MEEEKVLAEEKTTEEMHTEETQPEEIKQDAKFIRKQYSRIGWFLVIYYAVSIIAVLGVAFVCPASFSAPGTLGFWIINLLPMYCIGLPLAWLLVRKWQPQTGFGQKISLGQWFMYIPITMFFMGAGNVVGLALTLLADGITGVEYSNIVDSLATGNVWYQILFMVILGPIAEELIFRKIIISRLRVYGERTAILLSALLFGAYHGNLQQSCYAFALGLVFGYVYNKTDDLKTCVGLHMVVNFFSGVLPMFFLDKVSETTLEKLGEGSVDSILALVSGGGEELLALSGYGLCILVQVLLMIVGLVLFCIQRRAISIGEDPSQLPHRGSFRLAFFNGGVLVFTASMIVIGIISFGNV